MTSRNQLKLFIFYSTHRFALLLLCVINLLQTSTTAIAFDANETYRHATTLARAEKYTSAIPLLEKCVKYNENFEDAWLELSRCHFYAGNAHKAIQLLLLAKCKFQTPKTQFRILNGLILSYGKTGDLENLQMTRRELVTKFPNEPGSEELKKQIEYYDRDFQRTRKMEARHLVYKLEGYYPWLKFEKLPEMPIKVFFSAASDLKKPNRVYSSSVLAQYEALAKSACSEWAKATGGNLTFTFVDKEEGAQIVCFWTTDAKKKTVSWAGGTTTHDITPSQGPIRMRAVIFLDPGKRLSDEYFYEIALHELGHALGFMHTSNPADVMFSHKVDRAAHKHLSIGDIQLAKRVYSDPFVGKSLAEKYLKAAYIDKNYDEAYSLLSADEKTRVNQSAFTEKLQKEATDDVPSNLSIYKFDRAPYNNKYNYAFEGQSSDKKFIFHVAIVRGDNDSFAVTQARMVSVQPR